ncbi:hypothetical protein EDD11_003258 [Mortierella claussenii]|nr:hypothetical protein EDD11_003258 [Mortierella claussenii]
MDTIVFFCEVDTADDGPVGDVAEVGEANGPPNAAEKGVVDPTEELKNPWLGLAMMEEPVKVRGEVAAKEKEDEKDRWRGIEMERGVEAVAAEVEVAKLVEGVEEVTGAAIPPLRWVLSKALEIEEVELARW